MSEISKSKKKICWITSDYFTDCDKEIILHLKATYSIHWHLIYPYANSRFKPEDFNSLTDCNGLKIYHQFSKFRMRNPKNLYFFYKILRNIKKQNPDIVYINFSGLPYFVFLAAIILKKSKVIFTAHQAEVHKGLDYKGITKIYFKFWYSWFTYFNLFSPEQANIFQNRYPTKKLFVIPLALKEFGYSDREQKDDEIVFFNFGTIRENKNIGCMIDAACNLYQKGQRGFHVVLKGECHNWEYYQQKIRYPEIFTCDIRQINNDEIADMFKEYHYLVLPYSAVSQSGILKIALNYNVPIIASDLAGFKSEIDDGVNGYLFKSNNILDLENVLRKCIQTHSSHYLKLKASQKEITMRRYSLNSILDKYKSMFESLA